MRVAVVNYRSAENGILRKFAVRLTESLVDLGVSATLSASPDPDLDVNHHIIYLDFDGTSPNHASVETVMVTHIDYINKLRILKRGEPHYDMAICMSSATSKQLISHGLSEKKMIFINPAHDNSMTRRPIELGLFTNLYPDGRKNERWLTHAFKRLKHKNEFTLNIMGEGWGDVLEKLRSLSVNFKYLGNFNEALYAEALPRMDYFLYCGFDEGSMAFLDAVAAGVRTIVTPAGFHLDNLAGISHVCSSEDQLVKILDSIAQSRIDISQSVKDWTWRNYAVEHIKLWNKLLEEKGKINKTVRVYGGRENVLDFRARLSQTQRLAEMVGLIRKSAILRGNKLKEYFKSGL